MKRIAIILSSLLLLMLTTALRRGTGNTLPDTDSLRRLYARPVSEWPRPTIDSGVIWKEFAAIPVDTALPGLLEDPEINLGKTLFFDPRLSGSNQISCSSCHDPDLAWGDGRPVSLGHDHLQGTRNTISLLNVGIHHEFFWDGRAATLEDQAINPLATHHEMNMEPPLLAGKLSQINGYKALFKKAYGTEHIDFDHIVQAIAAFEKTIRSRPSRFDQFLGGNYKRMTDEEIQGLHLFRTKARCMNCHNGPFLTDGQFHNIGLTYYGKKYEDLGRYKFTQDTADVGRFRTPSLRDVMLTRPWMHNGLFDNMEGILNIYNSGMHMPKPGPEQENDPLFPKTDPLLQPLQLTAADKKALIAFLQSITSVPYKMKRPVLPQ